jgi:hypothetical protein
LVAFEQIKAEPWAGATEVVDSGQPREFRFVNDRFVILPDQSVATGHCYSFPKRPVQQKKTTPDPEIVNNELMTLTWRTPDFWVPSEREYAPIPFQESKSRDGADEVAFRTLHGVPVKVVLSGESVMKWSYGEVYSHEYRGGKNDRKYCSKLVVGAFEYMDKDGDGRFDEFFNSDANELIAMRPTMLARGELRTHRINNTFRFGWLLFTCLAIVVGVFCYSLFRRNRRLTALKHSMQVTENRE